MRRGGMSTFKHTWHDCHAPPYCHTEVLPIFNLKCFDRCHLVVNSYHLCSIWTWKPSGRIVPCDHAVLQGTFEYASVPILNDRGPLVAAILVKSTKLTTVYGSYRYCRTSHNFVLIGPIYGSLVGHKVSYESCEMDWLAVAVMLMAVEHMDFISLMSTTPWCERTLVQRQMNSQSPLQDLISTIGQYKYLSFDEGTKQSKNNTFQGAF